MSSRGHIGVQGRSSRAHSGTGAHRRQPSAALERVPCWLVLVEMAAVYKSTCTLECTLERAGENREAVSSRGEFAVRMLCVLRRVSSSAVYRLPR